MKVTLPIKTISVMNAREHYMTKARRTKLHRSTAFTMLKAGGKPPTLPVTITMTRIGAGTLDDDNLASACKAAQDGIADWLGIDDGNPGITWVRAQEKSKRGVYGLVVEVAA